MAEAPGAAPTPEKAAAIAMTVASPAVLWSGKALACNQAKRSQWMVSEKPADEHQFYCLARSHFLLSHTLFLLQMPACNTEFGHLPT